MGCEPQEQQEQQQQQQRGRHIYTMGCKEQEQQARTPCNTCSCFKCPNVFLNDKISNKNYLIFIIYHC